MKRNIFIIALIGITIVFSGCDYVDFPYTVPGPNGCTVVEPSFTPRTSPVRKVLIEDVTGHRCGNCPRAAETITGLIATYGDQIVPIGLHSELSGNFTDPEPNDTILNPQLKYIYDFRSLAAKEIDAQFGVSTIGLPNGMVNRKDFGGGKVVGYGTWSTHVASVLAVAPDMDIQVKSFWDPAANSLCSFVYVEALNNLSGTYKMVAFVVEDSMVHWQKDYMASPSTDLPNYIHRHVLRGSLNGTWGTPVTSNTSITDGETFIDGYSITVDPTLWDLDQLYIAAFVYNATTYEVIQAEEVKVMP